MVDMYVILYIALHYLIISALMSQLQSKWNNIREFN